MFSMHWKIKTQISSSTSASRMKEIIDAVLLNRGIKGKKQVENFINPPPIETISLKQIRIDPPSLQQAVKRIKKAIHSRECIVIFGDYDADGICATGILWEALHALKAQVYPFIPHREQHGYGLSIKGLHDLIHNYRKYLLPSPPSLIITVDNGITAHQAVEFASAKGIDVIITDHHQPGKTKPQAHSIVHTTSLAGSGVAWVFVREIVKNMKSRYRAVNTLDLAAIGSVADMVPLVSINRSLVKHGLQRLKKTSRIGLLQMFQEASVSLEEIDTYHINFIIAPRLNAMGRLDYALDSLRLLCTKNGKRAKELAFKLGKMNRRRQELTEEMLSKAEKMYKLQLKKSKKQKIIIINHSDFHEGVIGLVAGKLSETYGLPAVVISQTKTVSKASARSIPGFDIIKALRKTENLLVDVGGHPLAAGFTVKTTDINKLKKALREISQSSIDTDLIRKEISLDCAIKIEDISWNLFKGLNHLKPFGIANPKPRFALLNTSILEAKPIGMDGRHLKVILPIKTKLPDQNYLPALWFYHGEEYRKIRQKASLAFTVSENRFQGKTSLQLIIEDLIAF